MKDEKHKHEGQAGAPAKDRAPAQKKNSREDRLKLALRENLKRRKSQARGRSDVVAAPSNADEVSSDEGVMDDGRAPSNRRK
jgi:hypothetical protein